jgi:cytochrome c-type biogenesis protein CcmH
MTILVLAAVALLAVSVWFLAQPLRRVAAGGGGEDHQQLMALRERLLVSLKELDIESADRNMEESTVADERRRLEAELAQVLRQLEVPGPTAAAAGQATGADTRRHWLLVLVAFGIGLPLLSGGLYYLNQQAALQQLAGNSEPVAEQAVPPMALEMVARLEKRLAEQPNDPQGWARLGRAYVVMGRVDDARKAYERAAKLAPADVEVLSAYGSFLVSLSPQEPPTEAVTLYRQVLKLDARHPGALWVLGIEAYNKGQFSEAVGFWERLLAALPPQSEIAPQVQRAIDAAKERQRAAR